MTKGDDPVALETFYGQIDGDLADVRRRLLTDERIEKFIGIFMTDRTFATLVAAFSEGDAQTAFRASHTLKGMARDLGFTSLAEHASELTEALRADDEGVFGDLALASAPFSAVRNDHQRITEALPLLEESHGQ